MTAPTVADHYAPGALTDAVLSALRAAGKDVEHLTLTDLAPLDQYHIGAIRTTRDPARLVGPEFPSMGRNYARNCAEGRVVVIQGLLDRAWRPSPRSASRWTTRCTPPPG